MAPIKFEEKLKDKLEKRSLSPSSDGWMKLSERLDAEEKKSKNPWFWWIGIAAGVIIMLGIAVQSFSDKDVQSDTQKLVEEEIIENSINDKGLSIKKTETIEVAVEDDQIKAEVRSDNGKKQPQIIKNKAVISKVLEETIQVTDNTKREEAKRIKTKNDITNEQQNLIQESVIKTDAVIGALKEFKTENRMVSDKEVDSLLKLASKELFKSKLQRETSKTVDANSLLLSVEDEMGQSFRSKVFDALKDSFETVKTAVAERNN